MPATDAQRRRANVNWQVTDHEGKLYTMHQHGREGASLAVLLDIRDELRTLNQLLGCRNFTNIPKTLREIHNELVRARKAREANAKS